VCRDPGVGVHPRTGHVGRDALGLQRLRLRGAPLSAVVVQLGLVARSGAGALALPCPLAIPIGLVHQVPGLLGVGASRGEELATCAAVIMPTPA